MYLRSIFAACAAVVLCASLVETAQAYPITARLGTTTVTGTYRPIDLDLVIVEGAGSFTLSGDGYVTLDLNMTGTFKESTGSSYTASGPAGNWQLHLEPDFLPALVSGNSLTVPIPNYIAPFFPFYPVGTLTFAGGGDFSSAPAQDRPRVGDTFLLFPTEVEPVPLLQVTCTDPVEICGSFVVTLLQSLQHVGPYVMAWGGEGFSLLLDDGSLCARTGGGLTRCTNLDAVPDSTRLSRVNDACYDANNQLAPCGDVPAADFRVAGVNVPEPAGLALVGIALAGLAYVRRRGHPGTRTV